MAIKTHYFCAHKSQIDVLTVTVLSLEWNLFRFDCSNENSELNSIIPIRPRIYLRHSQINRKWWDEREMSNQRRPKPNMELAAPILIYGTEYWTILLGCYCFVLFCFDSVKFVDITIYYLNTTVLFYLVFFSPR